MGQTLTLACPSAEALSQLLKQSGSSDTLLLSGSAVDHPPGQFETIALCIELPHAQLETNGEVLQVLPGAGVVVRLLAPAEVQRFADDAGHAPAGGDREDTADATEASQPPLTGRPRRKSAEVQIAGSTPLSWPIERLLVDWHSLNVSDKVRVARHGKRPARNLVIKTNDKTLLGFLLQNSRVTADEVAIMAGMANLDPDLLRRIAMSPEWTRHTAVGRNLVCNPKLSTTIVKKLLDKLPIDELRRLAKSGRVRAATKQMIVRKLDRGR